MRRVFSRPSYVIIALATALLVYLFLSEAIEVPFFFQIISVEGFHRAMIVSGALFLSAFTDASITDITYALVLSLLIGINTALLVFFKRFYAVAPTNLGFAPGVMGAVFGLLGFGCAACGSVFVASLLAAFGGAGALAALPYGGSEFGAIGFILLLISCWYLDRAINKPSVCPI